MKSPTYTQPDRDPVYAPVTGVYVLRESPHSYSAYFCLLDTNMRIAQRSPYQFYKYEVPSHMTHCLLHLDPSLDKPARLVPITPEQHALGAVEEMLTVIEKHRAQVRNVVISKAKDR